MKEQITVSLSKYVREQHCTFLFSCQYHISGLKEIFLPQLSVVCAMKFVAVKGAFRDVDVFGVTQWYVYYMKN